jgi:sarcosine oxidase, subunit gamma
MREFATAQRGPSTSAALQIELKQQRSVLRLRSWHGHSDHTVLLDGRSLPTTAGAVLALETRVLCLGPGDWLVLCESVEVVQFDEHVERQVRRQRVAVVDQTDALVTIEASGQYAREVLSKGCGVDFHPGTFHVDQCVRTRLAQIPAVIDCRSAAPRFDLYLARSHASYMSSWLLDAAAEFIGHDA